MLQQVRTHDYTLGWTPDDGSAPPPVPQSDENPGDKANIVKSEIFVAACTGSDILVAPLCKLIDCVSLNANSSNQEELLAARGWKKQSRITLQQSYAILSQRLQTVLAMDQIVKGRRQVSRPRIVMSPIRSTQRRRTTDGAMSTQRFGE
jgi:hypothetical protein